MNVDGGESPQYRRLWKGLCSNIVFPHTFTQICGHDLVVLKLSLTMKRNLNFVAIRVRVSQ